MKKLWLVLVAGLLLACSCSSPSLFLPTATATQPAPTADPGNQVTMVGYTVVILHPDDGDLSTLLDVEQGKANALGQHMFVEFDASW
jgi:uncharacterized lipoprotein YajG